MATKTKKAAVKRGPFILQDVATKQYLTDADTFTADPMVALTVRDERGANEQLEAIRDEGQNGPLHGITFRIRQQGEAASFGPLIATDTAPDAAPTEEKAGTADDEAQPEAVVADDDPEEEGEVVQGELLPVDAGAGVVTPRSGLQLTSPGAARMTALGLKAYAADLKKEAKNLRELGKEKEAQSCDADAAVITQTLLPQLEPQVKIPFGYADVKAALSARISGALRAKLSEQIRRDTPILAGETDKDRQDKIKDRIDDFEELVGSTAVVVTALVEPVITQAAEKGMLAGRLARETTADTIALEAIEVVSNA